MKKLFFALAGIAATIGIVKHNKKAIMKGIAKHFTPEKKARHMVNRLGEKLNLTYAQKDQLQPILEECITKFHTHSDEESPFYAKFKENFANETFDAESFAKSAKEDMLEEKVSDIAGLISSMHGILTETQREKLLTIIDEKKRGFGCCHHGMSHGLRNNCC